MKAVNNDNLKINYKIYGNGHPTLLFIHGSFNDQTYWDSQVAHFKNHYKIVTMDLGGHGESGKNRDVWTIEEFGEDIGAALKQLELRDVIIIGHSMGADAMLEAAVEYPENLIGLVAVDYFKNVGTQFPEDQEKQIMESLHTNFSKAAETYARTGLLTPETPAAVAERVTKAYRDAEPDMGMKSIASTFGYAERESQMLQKLKLKVHLINVDYQPTNPDALRRFTTNFDLHAIHGTSHFPMIENPEEFNQKLEKALSEIIEDVKTQR